jgi:hypothetical protein
MLADHGVGVVGEKVRGHVIPSLRMGLEGLQHQRTVTRSGRRFQASFAWDTSVRFLVQTVRISLFCLRLPSAASD